MVSFSDGLPDEGHGIPYFYLTTLDPTASNALKDQRSSLTISEYPVGTCGKADPENPTCSKITLTGKVCCMIIHYLCMARHFVLHDNFSSTHFIAEQKKKSKHLIVILSELFGILWLFHSHIYMGCFRIHVLLTKWTPPDNFTSATRHHSKEAYFLLCVCV